METKLHNATRGPVPQHTEHRFEMDGVVISSEFDSGNVGRAEKAGPDLFYLWTAPDCADTPSEVTCRSWFYFHVTAPRSKVLTFVVKNLNLQGKLFREGMKPVVKSGPDGTWVRVSGVVSYAATGEGTLFEVTFRHVFAEETAAYFAFSYPWSYEENLGLMERIGKGVDEDVYFHRENMIQSLEGRRCDLLTISSYDYITDTRESHPSPLFPENQRPFQFLEEKKVVFVTGRVHPGETPGSHMLNGFLKWVTGKDPRAVEARRHFVFKIIPILNPDGVFRGYYRTDTVGVNLNRFYQNPDVTLAPTIWATKTVIASFTPRLFFYVDLHGHASKRGVFLYGNYMDFPKQVESLCFAKLMSINCANFDFEGSIFTEKNMKAKDKRDGLSKEGSGRVALYRATNLTLCFTMEANYHSGTVVNPVPESGLEEGVEAVSTSNIYQNGPPAYTVEILEDAGRAIGLSLLDFIDKNPFSRVKNSDFGGIDGVKMAAAEHVATLVPFRFNSDVKKLVKNRDLLLATLNPPPPPKKKPEKSDKPTEKRPEKKTEITVKTRTSRPPRPKTDKIEVNNRETSKPRASSETPIAVVNVKIKNFVMPKPVSPRTDVRKSGNSPSIRLKPLPYPRRAAHSQHVRTGSRSRSTSTKQSHDHLKQPLPESTTLGDGQAE